MKEKRIKAVIQPQAWMNDHAVDIDSKFELDVTDAVLDLSRAQLHSLRDNHESSDALVDVRDPKIVSFDGPYTVSVIDRVLDFFEVNHLGEINEERLRGARLRTSTYETGSARR